MASKGKVALVGSGLVGKSWATLFLKAGYSVCMYDTSSDQLKLAVEGVRTILNKFCTQNLVDADFDVDATMQHLSTTSVLKEAIADAIFLQESVPENLELKTKVFSEVDSLASDDIILSSSTSCLFPTKFTSKLKHKEQCIVSHPVNPPYLVPLVEVIPAPYTKQAVTDRTLEIMKDIGQKPVLLNKEVNGFVLNRLQYALLMEAWRLVEDGVCSPEDIDTVITAGLGLRWSLIGPFKTIHLNSPGGVQEYCSQYGENIERVCREQESTRSLSGDTANRIHEAMCNTVPVSELREACQERDKRLAKLAVHRRLNDN